MPFVPQPAPVSSPTAAFPPTLATCQGFVTLHFRSISGVSDQPSGRAAVITCGELAGGAPASLRWRARNKDQGAARRPWTFCEPGTAARKPLPWTRSTYKSEILHADCLVLNLGTGP